MYNLLLGSSGWDVITFLENAKTYIGTVGNALLILLGLILIIVSGVKIWRNFTTDNQQKPPRWGLTIAGLLIGGAMFATGTTLLMEIAQGGQKTIEDLGSGGVITSLLSLF